MGIYKYSVEINCTYCKQLRTRIVGNLSSDVERLKTRNNFCSPECRTNWSKENIRKTRPCNECSIDIPLRRKFCSRECYRVYISKHPDEFDLKNKITNTRSCRTDERYEKSIKTKKKNGNMINWDNTVEWKQYYRKCDALIRKMKTEMLKDWDGYDFYDYEFIQDNFSLSPQHSDYPSLDHKLPRSEGFRLGMTPEQITQKGNLVWTKRFLNTVKKNSLDNPLFQERILQDDSKEAIEFNTFLSNFSQPVKFVNIDKVKLQQENLLKKQKQETLNKESRRKSKIKAVCKIDINTLEIIEEFDSIIEAETLMRSRLNLPLSTFMRNISATVTNKQNTAYGFKWEYKQNII